MATIDLRPDDLALPLFARLSDDFFQYRDSNAARARPASRLHNLRSKGTDYE